MRSKEEVLHSIREGKGTSSKEILEAGILSHEIMALGRGPFNPSTEVRVRVLSDGYLLRLPK